MTDVKKTGFGALTLIAGTLLAMPASGETLQAKVARLGWLDKLTARVGEITVPVGETGQFGTMSVQVKSCIRRVPPDEPESAAYMEVFEGDGAIVKRVFDGWMFASSPSLSSMDHSVYDVWVLECDLPPGKGTGSGSVPSPDFGAGSDLSPSSAPDSVPLD